jgi:CO/xanthine dehydrogenase Mo-binding subunit
MVSRKDNVSGSVGKSILRFDGPEKVKGKAQYVDDLKIDGCWHAVVVRSPLSHCNLKGISFDASYDWSSVVVVTKDDITGTNLFDMHDRLMPVLADELKYKGEAYALVAAPTKEMALDAAEHITPDLEELPFISTLEEVVEQFKTNSKEMHVLCQKTIERGSLEDGFANADYIVEHEYRTGFQEQLYLEPNGLIAVPQDDGGMLVIGSMQCPFYIVNEAHRAIGLTKETLRARQAVVGGAFGGKEEFPSVLGAYASLLAMKAKRPVRLIFDREEDLLYSTKRHPSWIRHKTGLKKDGTITAIDVDYILDGGAYLTISDVVMYRGILHAAMGYRCENVFVKGKALRTNTFPNGAFRGFGAPQAVWAFESHVDKLAAKCSMTPSEFRLKNCIVGGDITPTGQVLDVEATGSKRVLEDTLKFSAFDEKFSQISKGKTLNENGKYYGVGLSFFAHGAAFTGDGEVKIGAKVALELDRDSRTGACLARVLVSSTEMGQGALTVLRQSASHGLGIPVEKMEHPLPDTGLVPDSGPTVASRTTMVVGSCLFRAGVEMRQKLISFLTGLEPENCEINYAEDQASTFVTIDGKSYSFDDVAGRYLNEKGPLKVFKGFTLPDSVKWDQETFKGASYPDYAWGCAVVELEVDPVTYEIDVQDIWSTWDVGTIVNPMMCHGQIEGGLTQALGYALMEKITIKNGLYDTRGMQAYVVPTALDIPKFHTNFIEVPYPDAEPGAKGIGEIPLDGLAPAIGNAIAAATGFSISEIPVRPEDLMRAAKEVS